MRVSNLGLEYLAAPGIEPRTVHVQPPNANTHSVRSPGQGMNDSSRSSLPQADFVMSCVPLCYVVIGNVKC